MRFPAQADVADAHRWWKNGDHPQDNSVEVPLYAEGYDTPVATFLSEGAVVRRFNHPEYPGDAIHTGCGNPWDNHGWIDNGTHNFVCPGDWIVTHEDGSHASVVDNTVWMQPAEGFDDIVTIASCRDCEFRGSSVEDGLTHQTEVGHTVDTYEVSE